MIYNLAIIGDPVEHSISPLLHSRFLEQTRLQGSYIRVQAKASDLENKINSLMNLGFRGANVTIPHKEAVLKLIKPKNISDEVVCIGAANTLIFDGGEILAKNTDYLGFWHSLPEYIRADLLSDAETSIGIIGAGGSARGVVFAIMRFVRERNSKNIHFSFLVKDNPSSIQKANNLILDMKRHFSGMQADVCLNSFRDAAGGAAMSMIVNTSPIGMSNHSDGYSPLSEGDFGLLLRSTYIYDLIYNPTETKFLQIAKEYGLPHQNGLDMLLCQAIYSFQHWTGILPSYKEKSPLSITTISQTDI